VEKAIAANGGTHQEPSAFHIMINWSNHDRAAFNDWCNTELGRKFLQCFKESRPKFDTTLDINSMAMTGAIYKGYEQAIETIDKMRYIAAPKTLEPRPYVKDTHQDNPEE
jgi:hypothetical protein